MKAITFVTTNPGKVASLRRALESKGIEVNQTAMDLPELQTVDLTPIAEKKALAAYDQLRTPLVVQDSGFFIPSCGGFPGPFTKFALETIGLDGILDLVKTRGTDCSFKECLAYYDGLNQPIFFKSDIPGSISEKPCGIVDKNAWSNLNLIFRPIGTSKTLGEMDEEELSAWRKNRGNNSAQQFAEWLPRTYQL